MYFGPFFLENSLYSKNHELFFSLCYCSTKMRLAIFSNATKNNYSPKLMAVIHKNPYSKKKIFIISGLVKTVSKKKNCQVMGKTGGEVIFLLQTFLTSHLELQYTTTEKYLIEFRIIIYNADYGVEFMQHTQNKIERRKEDVIWFLCQILKIIFWLNWNGMFTSRLQQYS